MVNLSITQRVLAAAIFVTLAVGCTEQLPNDPAADQVLAEEKKADSSKGPSLQVTPAEQTINP